jgi:hypothetical protein
MNDIVTTFLREIVLVTTLFSVGALVIFSIFFGFLIGNGYLNYKYEILKKGINKKYKIIKKVLENKLWLLKKSVKNIIIH